MKNSNKFSFAIENLCRQHPAGEKYSAQTAIACLLISAGAIFNQGCALENDGALRAVKVEIATTDEGYVLLRGGTPYKIKGAGIEFGDVGAFAAHGGNSLRTWRTDNGVDTGRQVLDRAENNGVTVSMCIEIGRERHGFDYNDADAVAAQLEEARQQVLAYKDHPALLTWIIGNEANLEYANPKVFDAINDISVMIHELDPNHPTTTALAGFSQDLVDVIGKRAPDLDFLSIQMYGDIVNLPDYIHDAGFRKPYFVTEWGAMGHWEVANTTWGAPIEQDSSTKANTYLESYRRVLEPYPHQAIGSYVFLWGQKQERTPTWYGMFTETGEETETVDVMHYIWNGEWPENRSPLLRSMRLDGKSADENVSLSAGRVYDAAVEVVDNENDPISYRWEVKQESTATQSGGDHEEIVESLAGIVLNPSAATVSITAPVVFGAYRLFVYAYDGQGHAAHANIPFYVEP